MIGWNNGSLLGLSDPRKRVGKNDARRSRSVQTPIGARQAVHLPSASVACRASGAPARAVEQRSDALARRRLDLLTHRLPRRLPGHPAPQRELQVQVARRASRLASKPCHQTESWSPRRVRGSRLLCGPASLGSQRSRRSRLGAARWRGMEAGRRAGIEAARRGCGGRQRCGREAGRQRGVKGASHLRGVAAFAGCALRTVQTLVGTHDSRTMERPVGGPRDRSD